MLRLASIFFCLVLSHSAAAQSIDLGQILQRGVNEAVRSMTAPPPPVYQPPVQPPYSAPQKTNPPRPSKVQRKAPVKSAGAAASGLGTAGPAAGPSGNAAAQTSAMPKTTVTRSPLIQPIALSMYQGLPIANTLDPRRNVSGGSMQQMGLWLGLINLSRNPALLDAPKTAFPIAKDYVTKEYWDTYFRCLKGPCSGTTPQGYPPGYHTVVAWAGDNEFARTRSYQAFVDAYRDVLLAEAAGLPLEIYFVATVKLGEYSPGQGGMPIDWAAGDLRAGGQKPSARPDNKTPPAIVRKIGLAPTIYADTRLATPLLLPCALAECEKILMQTSNRTLYALLKLRVLAIDNQPDERGRVGNTAAPVGPIALYSRPTLDKPVFQFPGVDVPPAALLAPESSQFKAGPMPFNTDSMHLLVLKHHPKGALLLNHQQAGEMRKQIDEKLHDLALENGWPTDDPWGPFFPSIGAPSLPLDADVIEKFQAWSMQRAQAIPTAMTLRFQGLGSVADYPDIQGKQRLAGIVMPVNHWVSGSGHLPVKTGTQMAKDGSGSMQIQPAQIGAAENLLLVSLPGGHTRAGLSNEVLLVFPEPVFSYAMPTSTPTSTSAAQPYSPAADQNRVSRTEMDVLIKDVSFAPSPRGDVMVIQIEPQRGRLYTNTALIEEGPIERVNTPKHNIPAMASHALPSSDAAVVPVKPVVPMTPKKSIATAISTKDEPPPQFPFDHDIVGLKLGMPVDEADTVARKHLEPELIYSLTARNPAQGYQQGRQYISFKQNESIVLVQGVDNTLAGIERQLVLPPLASLESILRQLVAKYGEPQQKLGPTWNWWPQRPPAYCSNAPIQAADIVLLEGMEPDPDSPLAMKLHVAKKSFLPFSYTNNAMRIESLPDRSTCLPVLGATITTTNSGAGDTRNIMRFVMYDHGAYTRAQAATLPAETLQTKVKM